MGCPFRPKSPFDQTTASNSSPGLRLRGALRSRPSKPCSRAAPSPVMPTRKPPSVCLGRRRSPTSRGALVLPEGAHHASPARPINATLRLLPSPAAVTSTKLMKAYFAYGLLGHAREMFDKMPHRDVVAWTAMISGYSSSGHAVDALQVFREMMAAGVAPNAHTVSVVLTACRDVDPWPTAASVHALAAKCGVDDQPYVENALLDVYMACDGEHVPDACAVFEGILSKTAVSWTTMIAGYVRHGDGHSAVHAFRYMLQDGVELSPFSCSAVIRACAMIGSLASGKQLHSAAVKFGYQMNLPVSNSLLDLYCRCLNLSEAKRYFDEMPTRDLITWNTIIAGLEKFGSSEAIELLIKMGSHDLQPNCFTFTSIVAVCANLAMLDCGQQVHGAILRRGYGENVPLANALVDMYAKCGNVVQARNVFDEMAQKDLVSWTSVMIGYGIHGFAEAAMELFDEMVSYGILPDIIVFMGLINACSHAGLIDEGLKYFNLMVTNYNVEPSQELYGCVIDLLGRAGRIEEARELVDKMNTTPDRSAWGALLGACKMHGNTHVGRLAAQKIITNSELKGAEAYVILSNIFAADGEWGEFARTRRLMKGTGSKKEAGRSWIEVRSVTSSFVAGDRHHPLMASMYQMLESLLQNMKRQDCKGSLDEIT